VTGAEHWEPWAKQWAAWARRPDHDSYWRESGPPFLSLLPDPGRLTLDLGCGEGRVARDLKVRKHRVVGIDASPTLVRLAEEADPGGEYLIGDAAALPFDDASFEMTVRRNGHEMHVRSWAYPIEDYTRALEQSGFLIEALREPPDPHRPLPTSS
jgi:ubiquinone/menaquinone biosynthesis C-methylase UbiE